MQPISTTLNQVQQALAILNGLSVATSVSKTTGVPVSTEARLDNITAALTELAQHVEGIKVDDVQDDARVNKLADAVADIAEQFNAVQQALVGNDGEWGRLVARVEALEKAAKKPAAKAPAKPRATKAA